MSRPVIELEGVGKCYRLGEHLGEATDLREAIVGRFMGIGRRSSPRQDLWALQDMNLAVNEGESLGIVGRNGAGKSTFLKIVAGVTTPTVGLCRTRGRIGSLLEVGTGFHDELTGRENAYLSGAILGMKKAEVNEQLDEIVAFAGLEGFMDTPIKRYSSGMYLRLAFAVAAHLEADILLVDEVLAVGDSEFRRKCMRKMSEIEAAGRTVLFASHNLDALTGFCANAIWIDGGKVVAAGPSGSTVRKYLTSTAGPGQVVELEDDGSTAQAVVRRVAILDDEMNVQSVIAMGDTLVVELEIEVNQATPEVDVGLVIERDNGIVLLDENLSREHEGLGIEGRHRVRLNLPAVLTPAEYSVSVWLGTAYEDIAFHERVASFSVDGIDADRSDRLFDLRAPWDTHWLDPLKR